MKLIIKNTSIFIMAIFLLSSCSKNSNILKEKDTFNLNNEEDAQKLVDKIFNIEVNRISTDEVKRSQKNNFIPLAFINIEYNVKTKQLTILKISKNIVQESYQTGKVGLLHG